MITFKEIQEDVMAKFNYTLSDMTDAEDLVTVGLFKRYINMAQDDVYENNMPWMKREGTLVLRASYSTGTITATNGSATITGDGTTFTRAMEGQKIVITDGTDGAVVYRIKSFTDSTTLTLDTKYIHTGGAGLSFAIYYDTYTLPKDFRGIEVIKDIDVLTTYINDETYIRSSHTTSSLPTEMKMLDMSRDAFYDTGTVSITTATTAVIGVGTAFDEDMVGRDIQIDTYGKLYEITVVTDTENLTIGRGYGGSTVSGGKFKIDPPGLQQVRFHSAPSAAKIVNYTYWTKAISLQDDEDISPIPDDGILILGGIYYWCMNNDKQQVAQAKALFEEAVGKLSLRKVVRKQQTMHPVFG